MEKYLLQDKKIVLIDDTGFMRASFIKLLVELGIQKRNITEYPDGKAALEGLATRSTVDAIFCDWNMPEMNGLEFLRNLRLPSNPHSEVRVVMVTTVSEKDRILEALQYKLSGYILKPVSPEKLSETIEDLFSEAS